MTKVNLDYEVRSEVDLKVCGLDAYSAHPSTRVILASYSFDDDPNPVLWDIEDGAPFPADVREALADPSVEKRAFNAQFERVISRRVLKIDTPYKGWRCTMAHAYLLSFTGTLGDVGAQMGLPQEKQKLAEGRRLIMKFCKPQRVTKAQPHAWRDALTDPDDWALFGRYCQQDVVAELSIEKRLRPFYVPEDEWELYELDQLINDRGLPVDYQLIDNAIWMAARRKKELLALLNEITGLANSNSSTQMLPWLQKRGYPFGDLQKDTVKKVLKESVDSLAPDAVEALAVRREATRTSVAKYVTFRKAGGADSRFRFAFQFAGATRTARWAGRRVQAQNLPRTPKIIEEHEALALTTEYIRTGDYDAVELMVGEHMTALVGCIRSAIRAPDGYELRVCDLASIETCVIAWLANCGRLLEVIRSGRDAYKDFATILYAKDYDDVTKTERTNSKPAVLGAGYRLGGGDLKEGKRTGLWGYAENMGIDLTQEESQKAVAAYREAYSEVPQLWYDLERAVNRVLQSGVPQRVSYVTIEYRKPFIVMRLPSGRCLYYFKPRMEEREYTSKDGSTYFKMNFTYEGQDQKTGKWVRIASHGGKIVENLVQAIARDVLKEGLVATHKAGFAIRGHVHDEIIVCQKIEDDRHTVELLGDCMTRELPWAPGLPLGSAGWAGPFYKKD